MEDTVGEARTWALDEAESLCLLVVPAAVVVAVETPRIAIPMGTTMPMTWMRTPTRKSLKTHPLGN